MNGIARVSNGCGVTGVSGVTAIIDCHSSVEMEECSRSDHSKDITKIQVTRCTARTGDITKITNYISSARIIKNATRCYRTGSTRWRI